MASTVDVTLPLMGVSGFAAIATAAVAIVLLGVKVSAPTRWAIVRQGALRIFGIPALGAIIGSLMDTLVTGSPLSMIVSGVILVGGFTLVVGAAATVQHRTTPPATVVVHDERVLG